MAGLFKGISKRAELFYPEVILITTLSNYMAGLFKGISKRAELFYPEVILITTLSNYIRCKDFKHFILSSSRLGLANTPTALLQ